jgi:hypothetical protein
MCARKQGLYSWNHVLIYFYKNVNKEAESRAMQDGGYDKLLDSLHAMGSVPPNFYSNELFVL